MSRHTPLAVLVIHGIGSQTSRYADGMIKELTRRFARALRRLPDPPADPAGQIHIRPVHWAAVLQRAQRDMWQRLTAEHDLDYIKLRRYMIDFIADAVAYQITPGDREVYDSIHRCISDELQALAANVDIPPTAPLAVIGHSLGSVIASNYIWDMQHANLPAATNDSFDTPLTRCETLARLFTLGSPLALWSLRYTDPPFGRPVTIPSPKLHQHYPQHRHPDLTGQWLNFYDEDDVIAYPLKPLNAEYTQMVTDDLAINVGGLLSSWNPLSHNHYWTDDDVTVPMTDSLVRLWTAVNPAVPSNASES